MDRDGPDAWPSGQRLTAGRTRLQALRYWPYPTAGSKGIATRRGYRWANRAAAGPP